MPNASPMCRSLLRRRSRPTIPRIGRVTRQPHYGAQGLRGRVHRWAKAHNDFYLRYSPGPLYDLALSMLVRGLPRRGFRRRQFTPLRTLRR